MGYLGILVLALLPLSSTVSAIPSRPSILSKVPFPPLTDYKHRINGLWKKNNHRSTVRRATNDSDSANLWVVDTLYEGQDFFDGQVQYVDRDTAFNESLAYVTSDDKIVMKVDNTTWLTQGQNRKRLVRLGHWWHLMGVVRPFVHHCFSCSLLAHRTVGPNWPAGGEIDIFEGVHENTRNQATFHTADGLCLAFQPSCCSDDLLLQDYQASNCYAYADNNAGCGLINDSAASFGAPFNAVGGGVFASRWDSNGVWICESVWLDWHSFILTANVGFFHRSTIPNDITNKVPNPSLWGKPTALLSNSSCPPNKYFWDHQVQAHSNAIVTQNYVHVFRNAHVSGSLNAAMPRISPITSGPLALVLVALAAALSWSTLIVRLSVPGSWTRTRPPCVCLHAPRQGLGIALDFRTGRTTHRRLPSPYLQITYDPAHRRPYWTTHT
ncbi:hypothetical protein AG1IA_04064 [Rhizoctonia solani AG-1 IA]|uniref:GH16 domain-containing protein n=1 Tax=Thanatephorus cucumeris (strain AG1-IA) TaxID=983506 RepID=L8WYM1_THACA|nr:hypothetical protein AG1IA_04064 [Rhizoctonia solani AG-1 IA]